MQSPHCPRLNPERVIESSMEDSTPAIVENVIRRRRTEKVLCRIEEQTPVPDAIAADRKQAVLSSIETAGWAPFHYSRLPDGIAEPWRAHVVWPGDLKKLAVYLRDELGVTSKEPSLVAGSSALVLATWLPEFCDADSAASSKLDAAKQRIRDEEHLAAAAAMVQNLLLMLTAYGMGTYWSSGGRLREAEVFDYLGIARNERLLAAVFIEYPEMRSDSKERKPGSQRHRRSTDWIREVTIP